MDKEGGAFNLEPPKVLLPHVQGVVYKKLSKYEEPPIAKTKLGLEHDDEGEQLHEKLGLTHNGCPLCGTAPINNPTAFPTGYVGCYTCAFAYVEEWQRCPVTLRRVTGTAELRRVLG